MTAAQSFKIQRILEAAVGKEKATEFTEQIDEVFTENNKALKDIFLTKEDKGDIKQDIANMKADLRKDIFLASALQYLLTVGTLLGILSFIFQHYKPE
jgi:hypothetical protein